tara:strand:+ start:934 stop:1641 length:708 start_codon:yes stop_codon:yes gene_type:complete
MLRNVYLEGEMGEKFGTGFQIYAESVSDVIRCLDVNIDGDIRNYLIDCHSKDIGFVVDVADNTFEDEKELLMPMHEGDITITPMAAGSKSAFGKILAAIALVVVILNPALLPGITMTPGPIVVPKGAFLGMSVGTTKLVLGAIAINLAMAGMTQMMAPDPAVDTSQPTNYLFNGPQQNTVQGDPVPLLYGRLRVPGQPVNFEISGVNNKQITTSFNENGSTGTMHNIAGPDMEIT